MTRNIDPVETGAQTRTKEQDMDGLVASPHLDRVQTRAISQVENAGELILETAETGGGHEMGAYWKTAVAVREECRDIPGPDEDMYAGKTLATEERIRGEHQERERQREKAVGAQEAGISRASRAREDVATRRPIRQSVSDSGDPWNGATAQPVGGFERVFPDESESEPEAAAQDGRDPRAEFGRDALAAVNQAAMDLDDELGDEVALGRAGFSRCIARRVVDGDGDGPEAVMDAAIGVRRTLERLSTVRQNLADIDPYDQHETTVEVEVVRLFHPSDASQAQAGHVTDGSRDPVSVTVWQRAGRKPTLREGDRVRLERVKVNAYEGDLSLAVISDTEIVHLVDGNGRAVRRAGHHEAPAHPSWSVESRQHAWISDIDMDEAVAVTLGQERDHEGEDDRECEPVSAPGRAGTQAAPAADVAGSPAATGPGDD